ncbi:glycosyltransferase-like protein gnt13 [Cotesia glomerata]|uniref:glycosyltransferase-like protein gnt13 n=1 Tax=Cotesia glomerata TaxID=32391 RepID=UPI001D0342AB|nr:glycosyltransferase-like protein gnt13 [Cotesia glomerata]
MDIDVSDENNNYSNSDSNNEENIDINYNNNNDSGTFDVGEFGNDNVDYSCTVETDNVINHEISSQTSNLSQESLESNTSRIISDYEDEIPKQQVPKIDLMTLELAAALDRTNVSNDLLGLDNPQGDKHNSTVDNSTDPTNKTDNNASRVADPKDTNSVTQPVEVVIRQLRAEAKTWKTACQQLMSPFASTLARTMPNTINNNNHINDTYAFQPREFPS